jgi:hypothetical protein
MKTKCILTFDLEFWYNGEFLDKYLPERKNLETEEDRTELSTELILDFLKENQQRATFFVLGELAKKYSKLIKKIADDGHEVASHGYSHKPLQLLDKNFLTQEILASKEILESITGQQVNGFRAPNFSLNKKSSWALDILKKNFIYDSSIHPLTPQKNFGIKEFPPSLGGFYFRALPLGLYIFLVKNFSKSKIPILYFHPHELFDFTPKIEFGPWLKRKIKYLGRKNAWEKFKNLTGQFEFISIKQYLDSK